MELEITINKYINGELSGSALDKFEALLNKDQNLQEKVKFHMKVEKIFRINEEVENNESLKAMMNGLSKKHILSKPDDATDMYQKETEIIAQPEAFPENKSAVKRLYPFLLLAAAAAFLLFMFLPSIQNQSNSQIADNYFHVFDLNDKDLSIDGSETMYKTGRSYYKNGKFAKAKIEFNQYLQVKPDVPKVLLAKGCAQFKLTEFDVAIESFNKVLVVEDSDIYQSTAHWYLALCYLKKDDKLNAIKHLKDIKNGQDYFNEAQKVLELF